MKYLSLISGLILFSTLSLAEDDLINKLDALNIPSDKVTPLLSEDQLESVNERYSHLNRRHELTLSGANNFTADSHLETRQIGASYRFHINSRWSVGYRYQEYENKLSSAGEKLFDEEKLLPDTDFAIKSNDAFVNFNTIYGKLRLTEKQIVYFDQYIALGYGNIDLASGETNFYHLDLGFSFWIGENFSSRIGLKNEFYRQSRLIESENVHNGMGYLEIGYLFGPGARI